eukprot:Skav222327  [mRNA]  locus=scaffold1249:318906:320498:- [translate_table: standard]
MATSSGTAVALKNSPDFNRPVTLQVGAEPPAASPHKSVMEMVLTELKASRDRSVARLRIAQDQFFKRYYGEPAQSPHSTKFKPDPKAGRKGSRQRLQEEGAASSPTLMVSAARRQLFLGDSESSEDAAATKGTQHRRYNE